MKILYKILPDKGLIIHKYQGEFSLEDYKAAAIKLVDSQEWKSVSKSLMDLRNVTTNKSVELVDELIKIRNELNIQKKHTVYIVSNPMATVLAHLYIDNIPDSNYSYCTTLNKALSILGLELYLEEIEKILSEME